LRQAPWAWYEKLDGTLRKLTFIQSEHEHAIYYRGGGGRELIVGVYVDDLLITGTTPEEIGRFKRELQLQFKMADLGLLSFYLGLEIQQSSGGIGLCQAHYAMKILEEAGMGDCNSTWTPMEERFKLSRDSEAEEGEATLYRKLIGSLRYLVHSAEFDLRRRVSQLLHAVTNGGAHGSAEKCCATSPAPLIMAASISEA
jgi:hypothetical protein